MIRADLSSMTRSTLNLQLVDQLVRCNKLQCELARLYDIMQLKAIEKLINQIYNSNILLSISSDSDKNNLSQESDFEYKQIGNNNIQWEEIITNWLEILKDKQLEEDLDFNNLDKVDHPVASQDVK
ncbi:5970_t:CDS:2 [Scutellospora calospora]|uniref:5970_t:CDS:1 n=1 Tax=Scutellospora calospora TaxID=85575 RepID=A0ACA9LT12_9GLOM|nr:5970_t:CDS:2 [Scutellospora calospora]